jgi:hypothetical protein
MAVGSIEERRLFSNCKTRISTRICASAVPCRPRHLPPRRFPGY